MSQRCAQGRHCFSRRGEEDGTGQAEGGRPPHLAEVPGSLKEEGGCGEHRYLRQIPFDKYQLWGLWVQFPSFLRQRVQNRALTTEPPGVKAIYLQ